MDSAEAIVWGHEWTWGTNKHPPLSGYLAEIFFLIFREAGLSSYILSQTCVLFSLFFTYRLACEFFCKDKALLCTVFLEGVAYYTLGALEYNTNVLSLALFPALFYFFYKASKENRTLHWVLAGLLGGAALLTKYTNGLALLGMGLYLLVTGRLHLKNPKICWMPLCTVLVFLPHFIWLFDHHFYPFHYIFGRAKSEAGWLKHGLYPLSFLGAQLLFMLPSLAFFAAILRKSREAAFTEGNGWKQVWETRQKPDVFLLCTGLLPLLFFDLISMLAGIPLKDMWGFALLSMMPMLLFAAFPFEITPKITSLGLRLAYAAMLFSGLVYVAFIALYPGAGASLDGKNFAKEMRENWVAAQTAHSAGLPGENAIFPLEYVAGWIWGASHLAVYLPERPRVMFNMNPEETPWIDEKDFLAKGAMVIAKTLEDYERYQKRYPQLPGARLKSMTVKSLAGREKRQDFYWGVLLPER